MSETLLPTEAETLRARLLEWYHAGHRDLPWRHTRDPYRIWLSETMLQQTRVDTVIPYYDKFLKQFPTVDHLAAAPEEEVLGLWAGLGYYSRARNLHRAAQAVMEKGGGKFPDSAEGLLQLPGVGRYTAGAIASQAFGEVVAVVDGNVKRVLARLRMLSLKPGGKEEEKVSWALAEALVSPEFPGDFNNAVMELGAMVCLPKNPRCNICPLQALCLAHREGCVGSFPTPKKKLSPQLLHRLAVGIWREDSETLLLARRASPGLLGGLWELPAVDVSSEETWEDALRHLQEWLGVEASGSCQWRGTFEHVFSHLKMRVTVVMATGKYRQRMVLPGYDALQFWPLLPEQSPPLSALARKSLSFLEIPVGSISPDQKV